MSRSAVIKIVLFWLLFLVLHFAYKWFPSALVAAFSGNSEAFVQHAKIGMIAYSLACAGEYLLRRKALTGPHSRESFFYARLFTAMLLPWAMFVLWYISPTFYGQPLPYPRGETLYANLILLVMAVILVFLERDLEQIRFSRAARISIAALYVIALVQLIVFTYRIPWAGFFTE